MDKKEKNFWIYIALAVSTALIWNFAPFGKLILYPFTILATWFHEMGHGVTATILGASFHSLDLNPDGSGVAYWSGSPFGGPIGRGLIAAGGPLAPTLIGFIGALSSRNENKARLLTLIFSIVLIAGAIIWTRTLFGIGAQIVFGLIFGLIALKGKPNFTRYALQFISLQAFLSMYLSADYFFSYGGAIDGVNYYSDTAHLQQNLLLPYWLWAAMICAISIAAFLYSAKKMGER
jgi:hypothetical protein